MKRRALMLMALLLAIGFPLYASGGGETGATTSSEGPQYGGTLTAMVGAGTSDPGSPDIADGGFWAPSRWLSPVQERPLRGDFEKFGPRGTGEYPYTLSAFIPDAYMVGNILESWEVSANKVVWTVRQGIMWAGNRPNVMKSREMTAQDVVEDLIYFSQAPGGAKFKEMFGKIYANDKYSLTIEYPSYDVNLMYFVGYEDRALIEPPETRAAGASDWKNQVGTGPFMLEEYQVGVGMTYVKNPDYWKTTTIDGKEYKLPFIERLEYPIIPDPNIQTAALRTAKLDYDSGVPAQFWQTLEETAPELEQSTMVGNAGNAIVLRQDQAPTDNIDVRRALMKGTDLDAFAKLNQVEGLAKHWYPVYFKNPKIYTPLEKLPKDTRTLFDYDADKAKKMLADAGYPNGFTVSLLVESNPTVLDRAELLADQWSKLGVTVKVESKDMVSVREASFAREFDNMVMVGMDVGNPLGDGLVRRMRTGAFFNYSNYSSPEFDALAEQMLQELDIDKRNKLIKEASLLVLKDAVQIPLSVNVGRNYWWPWIKNYYGEYSAGDGEFITLLSHAWIDQDLKKQMGK